jgi:hypothetical protein
LQYAAWYNPGSNILDTAIKTLHALEHHRLNANDWKEGIETLVVEREASQSDEPE